MNLKEYYQNPMGKGSSVIPNRELIMGELTRKYKLLTDVKKISLNVYKGSNKDYIFHLIVPSESDRGNNYDIVIQFYTDNKDVAKQQSIREYDIRLFCNAPSFVFTYANAYKASDMLVPYLVGKFDRQVFKKDPVVRNPYKVVSYEKYVFFAIRYILDDNRLMNKDILDKMEKTFNSMTFKSKIRSADDILAEIQKLNKKIKHEKNEAKKKDSRKVTSGKVEHTNTSPSINIIKSKAYIPHKSSVNTLKPNSKIKKR